MQSHGLWRSGGGRNHRRHLCLLAWFQQHPLRVWFGAPPPYVVFPVSYQFLRGDYRQALGEHWSLAPAGLPPLHPIPSGSATSRQHQTTLGQETLPIEKNPHCPRASARTGYRGGRQPSKFPPHLGTLGADKDPHYWVAAATCPHRLLRCAEAMFFLSDYRGETVATSWVPAGRTTRRGGRGWKRATGASRSPSSRPVRCFPCPPPPRLPNLAMSAPPAPRAPNRQRRRRTNPCRTNPRRRRPSTPPNRPTAPGFATTLRRMRFSIKPRDRWIATRGSPVP